MDKPVKLVAVEGILVDSIKVKYSDIDINRHVCSMRYVECISNCFSLKDYKEKQIKRFEINYFAELLFDDKVSVFISEIEKDDFRFEIRSEGKISCKARMSFWN